MKESPVLIHTASAAETRAVGAALSQILTAGDLVILSGDLGAGKTTLVQGLGAKLGVRGRVTSPTYIISRTHPSTTGGPDLIHVDAYRVGDQLDLETVDLDGALEDSVTVVEWGEGKVEAISEERFEISLALTPNNPEQRRIEVVALGASPTSRLATLEELIHHYLEEVEP